MYVCVRVQVYRHMESTHMTGLLLATPQQNIDYANNSTVRRFTCRLCTQRSADSTTTPLKQNALVSRKSRRQ